MDRSTFEHRLHAATLTAIRFARVLVRQTVPQRALYLVYPGRASAEHLHEGEVAFADDVLPDGVFHGPWPAQRVVDFLWRDGMVPPWVDIGVEAALLGRAFIGLDCAGRFTDDERLIYHNYPGGFPPFHVAQRTEPRAAEPFDLHWRLRWRCVTGPYQVRRSISTAWGLVKLRLTRPRGWLAGGIPPASD